MEYWEFLIQREGDRGWRSIKTGNLQLMEGSYRIVANSNLPNTPVQIRMTHQSLGATSPQRRSQSRERLTNAKGLMLAIPFMQLQSGIWQFVCSGTTLEHKTWHRVLKLRVLPRSPVETPPLREPVTTVAASAVTAPEDLHLPTEPPLSLATDSASANWADELERLLEQIERDSLQPSPPAQSIAKSSAPIDLTEIDPPPLLPIELDRSTFSSILPGTKLAIGGACNLQLLSTNFVRPVKIDRLSICLRHPQTSTTIVSIECSIPPQLEAFTFVGQLELPLEPNVTLLRGEVNLYDRHNIQLGSSGFTVTLNLNPIAESERSLLSLFESTPSIGAERAKDIPKTLRERLDRELQLETFTPQGAGASSRQHRATAATPMPQSPPSPYPPVSLTYKREPIFTQHSLDAGGNRVLHPEPPLISANLIDVEAIVERSHLDRSTVTSPLEPPIEARDRSVEEIFADLPSGELSDSLGLDLVRSLLDPIAPTDKYDTLEIVVDD